MSPWSAALKKPSTAFCAPKWICWCSGTWWFSGGTSQPARSDRSTGRILSAPNMGSPAPLPSHHAQTEASRSMFYLISKFFGFFLIPLHFLVALGVVGVAMIASRQDRAAKVLMASSILLLAAIGFLPVGVALTLPLEQRFPPWTEGPSAPNGIIVLGGALDPDISKARHSFALSGGAERVTAGILLAHRFPNALLVFSGGDVDPRKPREAD